VVDPVFGRAVVVPERILRKIEGDHGAYFTPRRDVIFPVLLHPDGHGPDPIAGRYRYWQYGPGSGRWLFAVVDYDRRGFGEVVTAFPRRRLPPMP
jgi:hypothetical protein